VRRGDDRRACSVRVIFNADVIVVHRQTTDFKTSKFFFPRQKQMLPGVLLVVTAAVMVVVLGLLPSAAGTILIDLNVSAPWPGRDSAQEENSKYMLGSGLPGVSTAVEKLEAVSTVTAGPLLCFQCLAEARSYCSEGGVCLCEHCGAPLCPGRRS